MLTDREPDGLLGVFKGKSKDARVRGNYLLCREDGFGPGFRLQENGAGRARFWAGLRRGVEEGEGVRGEGSDVVRWHHCFGCF